MKTLKTLKDIEVLRGVRVLVTTDFNVPIKGGFVADPFRIDSAMPTIEYLREKGAKIILVSHLQLVDGENGSLQPVADYINKSGTPVVFLKDWKKAHETIENMKDGECILLENIRFFEGEKKNDPKFSKELASLADIFVNDAFSVSHRPHASIIGVPALLPSYAGLQVEKEIKNLSFAFNPPHPFLFILGGAKFATKLPLLRKFFDTADSVFIGGAMANDLYRQKGYEIGISLVSKPDGDEKALDLSEYANNPKLILSEDIVNQNKDVKSVRELLKTDKILDAGPSAIDALRSVIANAKFILWNGPLGLYEEGYSDATLELAKLIGEATEKGATSIVGGGDTLAAIETLGIEKKFSFISTGGGAMLDFLADESLIGLEFLFDN
ncbi:MAG: phosphoglycerate kinase [Candidatus Paceibacterota bacterium]|jgi:phosphoglycerate kinase